MRRLLVVDDDESTRKLIRFRLKSSYEITETDSPEDAVALAMQDKPDAVLLDLNMPKYSGVEVCQSMGRLSFTHSIPIIIISGEGASRYEEFCKTLGAKGYFQKPIDFDALQAKLNDVLGARVPDRRSELRIKLKVSVELRGTDSSGKRFNITANTENVSGHGFLCGCTAALSVNSIVEVFLVQNKRVEPVCKARVAHVQWPGTPGQQCGFQLLEKSKNWVLQAR
ncbi:MAG TPA: response regulator [Candidatus Acidoferrales bacterium]|nr:response regulator [Candidatus Acidoferrales bacterium]